MRIFYQSPVSREWIRQRPHFMADGLAAAGHRVFWFYAAAVGRCRFRRIRGADGRLTGLELPVLPFASRFRPIEWLNRLWITWWLRRVEADVLVATNPVALPWLPRRLGRVPAVYDCMDVQTAFFTGRRRVRMAQTEAALLSACRGVVASSDQIRDFLASRYGVDPAAVAVVPNGVRLAAASGTEAPVRTDRRPSIAYFGTVAPWFDWDAVRAAALRHPEWTFDVFGPVDARPADLPAGVVFHGPIPHGSVPAQMKAADVLVMPFVRNELIDGVDPVKMYEYLQAGRPIVSSWWPLLEKFRGFGAVAFYEAGHSLEERIGEALARPGPCEVPEEFLRANGWDVRVRAFSDALERWMGLEG